MTTAAEAREAAHTMLSSCKDQFNARRLFEYINASEKKIAELNAEVFEWQNSLARSVIERMQSQLDTQAALLKEAGEVLSIFGKMSDVIPIDERQRSDIITITETNHGRADLRYSYCDKAAALTDKIKEQFK